MQRKWFDARHCSGHLSLSNASLDALVNAAAGSLQRREREKEKGWGERASERASEREREIEIESGCMIPASTRFEPRGPRPPPVHPTHPATVRARHRCASSQHSSRTSAALARVARVVRVAQTHSNRQRAPPVVQNTPGPGQASPRAPTSLCIRRQLSVQLDLSKDYGPTWSGDAAARRFRRGRST